MLHLEEHAEDFIRMAQRLRQHSVVQMVGVYVYLAASDDGTEELASLNHGKQFALPRCPILLSLTKGFAEEPQWSQI